MDLNGITSFYQGNNPIIPPYPKDINPRAVRVGNDSELMMNLAPFFRVENVYNSFTDVPKRQHLYLRASLVNKLIRVNAALPDGFEVIIFDGHRNTSFQADLLVHFIKENPELQAGFVSDPSDSKLVAPHTTGGAVDLSLTFKSVPLDLGTHYDSFEPTAFVDALEGTPVSEGESSQLRRLLYHTMINEGFAPYPMEWWHWSYGDQWWAAFYGKDKSLYNAVELPKAYR